MVGVDWLIALPALLALVLFGGTLSRVALRIIIEAWLGYKRRSDRAVRDIAGAVVRTASVTYGLCYLSVSWTLRPFTKQFVKIERWVESRMVEPVHVEGAPAVLGLSAEFTREQLKVRYRHLMDVVHPDKGGSVWLAQVVNNAKDTIVKEKGWR
jgi:cytochrome bd-type quinol oxidase subunit 2